MMKNGKYKGVINPRCRERVVKNNIQYFVTSYSLHINTINHIVVFNVETTIGQGQTRYIILGLTLGLTLVPCGMVYNFGYNSTCSK